MRVLRRFRLGQLKGRANFNQGIRLEQDDGGLRFVTDEVEHYLKWRGIGQILVEHDGVVVSLTDYDELAPQQRAAHLVFWYESEVQNGGHLQYFTNHSYERSEEALRSLIELGAGGHARVLEQALTRWRSAARLRPADVLEYVAVALEAEFDDLDTAFHDCEVTLMQVLQRHFVEHEGNFIVRE